MHQKKIIFTCLKIPSLPTSQLYLHLLQSLFITYLHTITSHRHIITYHTSLSSPTSPTHHHLPHRHISSTSQTSHHLPHRPIFTYLTALSSSTSPHHHRLTHHTVIIYLADLSSPTPQPFITYLTDPSSPTTPPHLIYLTTPSAPTSQPCHHLPHHTIII